MVRLPDKPWTLHTFSHGAGAPPQTQAGLEGQFALDIAANGTVTGKHVCGLATSTGHRDGFDVTGSATDTTIILDEADTGLRYTGIKVVEIAAITVIMGDWRPPTGNPAFKKMREEAKRLGIRFDQEQGTWVATKP